MSSPKFQTGFGAFGDDTGEAVPFVLSFLSIGQTSAQTTTAVTRIVLDDVYQEAGSKITLDGSNAGRFTLAGGSIYLIVAAISGSNFGGSNSTNGCQLWDVTADAAVSQAFTRLWCPQNTSASNGGGQTLMRVLAPSSDTEYEFRTTETTTLIIRPESSSVTISEIG